MGFSQSPISSVLFTGCYQQAHRSDFLTTLSQQTVRLIVESLKLYIEHAHTHAGNGVLVTSASKRCNSSQQTVWL